MIILSWILIIGFTASSSAYRLPRSAHQNGPLRIRPSDLAPIRPNDETETAGGHPNTAIRRDFLDSGGIKLPASLKNYDVKIVNLKELKSLADRSGSLEVVNLVKKPKRPKKKVAFKSINVADFLNRDPEWEEKPSKAGKVEIMSPEEFFNKFGGKQADDVQSALKWLSKASGNDKVVKDFVKPKKYKGKKKQFDKDGMMYLTMPKDTKKLGPLLNKVFDFKAKKSDLRNEPEKEFTKEEIEQIKNMARAVDEEEKEEKQQSELDQMIQEELDQREEDAKLSKEREKNQEQLEMIEQLISANQKNPDSPADTLDQVPRPVTGEALRENSVESLEDDETQRIAELLESIINQQDTKDIDVASKPQSKASVQADPADVVIPSVILKEDISKQRQKNIQNIDPKLIQKSLRSVKEMTKNMPPKEFSFDELVS